MAACKHGSTVPEQQPLTEQEAFQLGVINIQTEVDNAEILAPDNVWVPAAAK
jgi:hypothetical protein